MRTMHNYLVNKYERCLEKCEEKKKTRKTHRKFTIDRDIKYFYSWILWWARDTHHVVNIFHIFRDVYLMMVVVFLLLLWYTQNIQSSDHMEGKICSQASTQYINIKRNNKYLIILYKTVKKIQYENYVNVCMYVYKKKEYNIFVKSWTLIYRLYWYTTLWGHIFIAP